MDPRTGRIIEAPDSPEVTEAFRRRGLVPIPAADVERVRAMSQGERMSWLAKRRREEKRVAKTKRKAARKARQRNR